jgi:flagellar protein FliT
MGVVHDLLAVTKELRDLVCAPVSAEKREKAIEAIERLLAQRDELLRELRPPYSEEEQRLGRQMPIIRTRTSNPLRWTGCFTIKNDRL